MDMDQLRPIVSRRRGAVMLGALALLVSAAPDGARLVFDPSAFEEDSCLAPAFTGGGCSYGGFLERDGETGLSASAALLEPQAYRERRPSLPTPSTTLLEPDLSSLFKFGPEVVNGVSRRRMRRAPPSRSATGSGKAAACVAAGRHRPDRSGCGGSGFRSRR